MYTVHVGCGCGCWNNFPIQIRNGEYILVSVNEESGKFGVAELPLIFQSIENWRQRGGKVDNILLRKV